MAGIPVILSPRGVPVRQVAKGGPAMTVSTNGRGLPVRISDRGAPFVVQGGSPVVPTPVISHDYTTGTVPVDAYTSFTRAAGANSPQFYDQPLGSLTPYATNAPRFLRGGLLIEESRQNQFLNGAAPVSQTITLATFPYYCIWMKGTGSLTVTVGTALGNVRQMAGVAYAAGVRTMQSASMTVTDGQVLIFNATTLGTIDVTVNGSVTLVQVENGPGPTTYIPTTGALQTRANDYLVTNVSAIWDYSKGAFFSDAMHLSSGRGDFLNNHYSGYSTDDGGTAMACFPVSDILTPQKLVLGIGSQEYDAGNTRIPWKTRVKAASSWDATLGTAFTMSGLAPTVAPSTFPPANFTTTTGRLGNVIASKRAGSMIWFGMKFWNARLTPAQVQSITA